MLIPWDTCKPIIAPNEIMEPYFSNVFKVMDRLGAPKLRVVEFETHFEACEGSHRLYCTAMKGLPVHLVVVNGLRVTCESGDLWQYRNLSDRVVNSFTGYSVDLNRTDRPVYRLNATVTYRPKHTAIRNDRRLSDSRIHSARTYANIPNPEEVWR